MLDHLWLQGGAGAPYRFLLRDTKFHKPSEKEKYTQEQRLHMLRHAKPQNQKHHQITIPQREQHEKR